MRKPKHIAVIPDGNRRWAASRGLSKEAGYQHGLRPALELLRQAKEIGIEEITFYGFTIDNCKRPAAQVQAFRSACVEAVQMACRAAEGADLLVVGNAKSPCFPPELRPFCQRQPVAGGGIRLNFLVNYGWEWDLAGLQQNATQSASRRQLYGGLQSADISRIDLVVRWGGRRRLSGLLPVQAVYADFYVLDELWPDWQPQHLQNALAWWNKQDVTVGG